MGRGVASLKLKGLVLLLLCTVSLTGCESVAQGPAGISRDGEHLFIAVCHDFTATRIYAETDTGKVLQPFISLDGAMNISYGTLITTERIPQGLEGVISDIDFDSTKSILIRFVGPGNDWASAFDSRDVLDVPEGRWLSTNGLMSDEPCPAGR